jgi:hypothetical protein
MTNDTRAVLKKTPLFANLTETELRALVVSTGAQRARRAGRSECRDHEEEGELGAGCGHPGLLD